MWFQIQAHSFVRAPSRKTNIFSNPAEEIGCGKSPIPKLCLLYFMSGRVFKSGFDYLSFSPLSLMLEPSSHPSCHSTISFPFGRASGVFAQGADSECFAWGHCEVPPKVSHIGVYRLALGTRGPGGGCVYRRFQALLSLKSKCFFLCLVYIYYGRFSSLLEKVLLSWCGLLQSMAPWNQGNTVVESLPRTALSRGRHFWKTSALWGMLHGRHVGNKYVREKM